MQQLNSFKSHVKKIGFLQTCSYLLQRLFLKKGSLIRLKIPGLENPVFLRNKYYDTHIFHQIFIREEVNFDYGGNAGKIVDCGANIGLSTLFFRRQYPDALIISIEPELSNFQLLSVNTKKYNNIKCLHAAIWYRNTNLRIIDNGDGVAAFTTSENLKPGNTIEEISSLTIMDIMSKFNFPYIDLIKIDIEGSEFEIFSHSSNEWTDRVKMVAVEIHENLKPGVTSLIKSILEDRFYQSAVGEYSIYIKKIKI